MARAFGRVSTHRVEASYAAHSGARSWALWARRLADSVGQSRWLFAKGALGDEAILHSETGSGSYRLTRGYDFVTAEWSVPRPAVGGWHHVCFTHDGTTAAPLGYVDGAPVTVTQTSAPAGSVFTNTDPYVIGNRAGFDRSFPGDLAELAVWNRVLSAAEVRSVWRNGAGGAAGWALWAPLWGVTSREPEFQAAATTLATVTGAPPALHPPGVLSGPLGPDLPRRLENLARLPLFEEIASAGSFGAAGLGLWMGGLGADPVMGARSILGFWIGGLGAPASPPSPRGWWHERQVRRERAR